MKKQFLSIRSALLVMLTHSVALPILKKFRKPLVFNYSELDLYMLAKGTLGNDLYHFLEKRNLPLLKHYVRHDIKHVLLDYDTTEEGEVCLQSFMLGNGRVSFPVLATVIYGFATMPEYRKKMIEAYKKGRRGASFHHWDWSKVITEKTLKLQGKILI